MRKELFIFFFLFLFSQFYCGAQELFPVTEPASNMAADALGLRLGGNFYKIGNETRKQISPEVMYGINARWMVHLNGYFSDYYNHGFFYKPGFKQQGFSVYLKYRFFTNDGDHTHFRMAAFGRGSMNPNSNFSPDINIEGAQGGLAAGLVATQLIHRLALSLTTAYIKPAGPNGFYPESSYTYDLSAGYLVFPRHYTSYKQVNMNVYAELLGKTNSSSPENNFIPGSALDIVPSVQFIFQARTRIDISYRTPISNSIVRNAPDYLILKIEYNLFNVFHDNKK
jgi:hypothetical protein